MWQDRYMDSTVAVLFDGRAQVRRWSRVEAAICRARGQGELADAILGLYGAGLVAEIREWEKTVEHDIAAYVDVMLLRLRPDFPEVDRHFHRHVASSDIADTATCILLDDAATLIKNAAAGLLKALNEQYRDITTPGHRVGRTHGQHAENTTWDHQLTVMMQSVSRAVIGLNAANPRQAMISGPVGYAHSSMVEVEEAVAKELGFPWSGARTLQILPRDYHARYVNALSVLASVCDNIALQVRLGSQTEIAEMQEGHGPGYKGSSSMPYKRNPVRAERICGLARQVRAQAIVANENIATWGERDLTQSSAERVMWETTIGLTHFILEETATLVRNLYVDYDAMQAKADVNSEKPGVGAFERMLDAGTTRNEAYRQIQSAGL